MIAVSSYLVEVDDENRYLNGVELTNDIHVLPVSGTVVESPLLENTTLTPGSRIFFQWNALIEADYVNDLLVLDPEFVYKVDGEMKNEWLWVEITEQLDNICNAIVIDSPTEFYALYTPGKPVMFERHNAHRIETKGCNTLNPYGMPLFAIRYFDIMAI